MVEKPERVYYLDWLRVISVFGVFFMHLTDFSGFNRDVLYLKPLIINGFFSQWLMPIFFLIAGASMFFSLSFRSPKRFIKSRILRLLLPYFTIGMFILVPVWQYIGERWMAQPADRIILSFIQYYQNYTTSIVPIHRWYPYINLPMAHLWFLIYLFIFSMILLPIFIVLRNRWEPNKSSFLTKPGQSFCSQFRSF